jgi:hypothetical protein
VWCRLRFIATIEDPVVVERILRHGALPTAHSSAFSRRVRALADSLVVDVVARACFDLTQNGRHAAVRLDNRGRAVRASRSASPGNESFFDHVVVGEIEL